jgi:acetyl esterase/lipase
VDVKSTPRSLSCVDYALAPVPYPDPISVNSLRVSQVGDSEVILCDSTEFAARAVESGASSVQLLVYKDMWHCWPMYSQLATAAGEQPLAEAQWMLDDLCNFLGQFE